MFRTSNISLSWEEQVEEYTLGPIKRCFQATLCSSSSDIITNQKNVSPIHYLRGVRTNHMTEVSQLSPKALQSQQQCGETRGRSTSTLAEGVTATFYLAKT